MLSRPLTHTCTGQSQKGKARACVLRASASADLVAYSVREGQPSSLPYPVDTSSYTPAPRRLTCGSARALRPRPCRRPSASSPGDVEALHHDIHGMRGPEVIPMLRSQVLYRVYIYTQNTKHKQQQQQQQVFAVQNNNIGFGHSPAGW